jgi:preprotein translocase SecE subunit
VARDRKRAKQRRARGAAPARGGGAATRSQPERADLPGALEHASGDVDEFDAALVRGAEGVVADQNGEPELAEVSDAESEDLLQTPGGGGDGGGGPRTPGGDGGAGEGEHPSGAPIKEGSRVIGFLRASWAELQRVQWPDRRQVTQATAVVLGFVAVAGAYLGLADYVAKEIVEFIL